MSKDTPANPHPLPPMPENPATDTRPLPNTEQEEAIKILMVEDDPGEARLTIEALKRSKVLTQLSVVVDGLDALEFLRREGKYSTAQRPDIILLDLNMPRMNGHEFLKIIKQDPGLQSVPIIVLTTSAAAEDIERCYFSHASCFITKPVGLQQFMSVVQAIESFWFTFVKLPPAK
jgi:chemotaxis family two-component system response regulator Rcp1